MAVDIDYACSDESLIDIISSDLVYTSLSNPTFSSVSSASNSHVFATQEMNYAETLICNSIPETSEPILIPNIFTPNNDNINDFWEIKNILLDYRIEIFDRWGDPVIKAQMNSGQTYMWDGKNKLGIVLNDGVYFYLITTKTERFKGFLQLVR